VQVWGRLTVAVNYKKLKKLIKKSSIIILSLACLLFSCSGHAERKVRKTFNIPRNIPVTTQNIRAAILKEIPIGTSEQDIYETLKELKIGDDKLTSFYPANEKGRIVCRFEYSPWDFTLIHQHYGIFFQLDNRWHLEAVMVDEWLTGM
jgi:hypothetical protein